MGFEPPVFWISSPTLYQLSHAIMPGMGGRQGQVDIINTLIWLAYNSSTPTETVLEKNQKQRWLLAFKETNQNTQEVKTERFLKTRQNNV